MLAEVSSVWNAKDTMAKVRTSVTVVANPHNHHSRPSTRLAVFDKGMVVTDEKALFALIEHFDDPLLRTPKMFPQNKLFVVTCRNAGDRSSMVVVYVDEGEKGGEKQTDRPLEKAGSKHTFPPHFAVVDRNGRRICGELFIF